MPPPSCHRCRPHLRTRSWASRSHPPLDRPAASHGASRASSSCEPVTRLSDAVCLPVVTRDPWPSALAPPRRIDVLLPPSYEAAEGQRFPVLYCHDGQNMADPATSFLGVDWGLDEALSRLANAGEVREFIAVLVWNTPQRFQEYMPADAVRWLMGQQQCWYETLEERYWNPVSDAYLDMLVQEVKPWVDCSFRTLPGRQDTALLGSSMGGLVSLYALQRHPQVFGAAACLSTNWTPGQGLPVAWLAQAMPDPANHRLYFDHGSEGLDAAYAPFQAQVDALCRAAGYSEANFETRLFPGEPHNEVAWRRRLVEPLRFLFGTGQHQQQQQQHAEAA